MMTDTPPDTVVVPGAPGVPVTNPEPAPETQGNPQPDQVIQNPAATPGDGDGGQTPTTETASAQINAGTAPMTA